MPPYEFQAYPSVRYHRTLAPVTVRDSAEDFALGAEWEHSPAAFTGEPASDAPNDAPPAAAAVDSIPPAVQLAAAALRAATATRRKK